MASRSSLGISLADDSFDDASEDEFSAKIEAHTPADPLIGQQVGNFRIMERIGRGGFGAVYRAEQIFLEESYAIKVLHINQISQPEIVKRFQREARALAQLNHEGIVNLSDFGMLPEQGFYLVMEYLKGDNLQDRLKSGEPFSLARVKNLVREMCDVLSYVHRKGVVHRDLKPGNIFLIEDEDGNERVKLIDFGIAALTDEMESITHTGTYLGTAKFASPEQAQGNRELDGRSDLYSLTVILFRLLTGRVPFGGKNVMNIIYQQIHSSPAPLSHYVPGKHWAPELENFLFSAFAKSPDDRPRDARDYWQQCELALDAQIRRDQHGDKPQMAFQTQDEMEGVEDSLQLATGELLADDSEISQQGLAYGTPAVGGQPATRGAQPTGELLLKRPPAKVGEFTTPSWSPSGRAPQRTLMDLNDPSQTFVEQGPRTEAWQQAENPFLDTVLEKEQRRKPVRLPQESDLPQESFGRKRGALWTWLLGGMVVLSFSVFGLWRWGKPSESGKLVTPPPNKRSEPSKSKSKPWGIVQARTTVPAGLPRLMPARARVVPARARVVRKRRLPRLSVGPRRRVRRRLARSRRIRRRPRPRVRLRVRYVGPCGGGSKLHWVFAKMKKPTGGKPRVRFAGCSACRFATRSGGFCLGIPKQRSRVRLTVIIDGYQTCIHSISSKYKKLWWSLKEEDPDALVMSTYRCARLGN